LGAALSSIAPTRRIAEPCRRDRQRIIVKAAITMADVVAGLVKIAFADITAIILRRLSGSNSVAMRPSVRQRRTSGHKHEGDSLGANEFFRGIARNAERKRLTIAARDLGWGDPASPCASKISTKARSWTRESTVSLNASLRIARRTRTPSIWNSSRISAEFWLIDP
jgi:hypothetical protein